MSVVSGQGIVRFAEFELDLRSGELRTNGSSVRLQPQPAKILALLVRRRGETVTRNEIIEEVWGSDTFVDYEQGLNFAIRQIRNALGDDAERPLYVETVPKRGYRFVAQCDGRRMRSLAVLPLEDLSHDPQQEYFAEGLTEALITALARIGELRVVSRTSAMQYKGVRKPLGEIARELKVDTIVEGTVMRVGRRVRVTMQLIDAPKETHLWAGSYERDLRNVLALQSEVAQAIAREVQVKLTPQEQVQFAQVHLVDPEAYEAYVKGRYHWSRGSSESLSRAIQYFNDAIRLDPSYAPGYAGLADAYSDLAVFNFQPPTEAFPKAKAAALRAIEIDSDLAEAHGYRCMVAAIYAGLGDEDHAFEWLTKAYEERSSKHGIPQS